MANNATFNMTFSTDETFETTMDKTVQVTTSDHRKLTNRDAEDQHPINSITNLTTSLGIMPNQALSNIDIQNILNL